MINKLKAKSEFSRNILALEREIIIFGINNTNNKGIV
jgi:hypothetical protein